MMLGDFGETLVVDWGLARVLSQEEESTLPSGWLRSGSGGGDDETPTQEGSALGTPAYIPPEQARGLLKEVGPASAILPLGATLDAILTGRAPYKGSDALLQAAACEWRPARQLKGDVPRPLEAICARAMAKEPAQRYSTARELAAEVEAYLA